MNSSAAPEAESASDHVRFALPAWVSDRRFQVALIALLPFAIYVWSLRFGLLGFDDSSYYANPALEGGAWHGLRSIWTTTILGDYAPISQLTCWIDLALFGNASFVGARLQSLLWFALGSVGVYALIARFTGRREIAFATALLYAAHPACAVSVLWLAERKNLVSFALAIWAVERYASAAAGGPPLPPLFKGGRTDPSRTQVWKLLSAWLLFCLALLAKPHALAVVPMLVAFELVRRDRSVWRALPRLAPFALLAAAYVILSMKLRIDLARPYLGGSRCAAIVSDGPILLRYLAHTVCPWGLALYYYAADLPVLSAKGWGCWVAIAFIVVTTVKIARDKHAVAAGWLLALAGLSPAINLVPQLAPMADHYLHWALPGFLLVFILFAEELLKYARSYRGPVVLFVLLCFSFISVLRNAEFQSRQSAFMTSVANEPDSALGWAGYAQGLIDEHSPIAGIAAVRALECPDQARILVGYRYVLAREAVVTLKSRNQGEHAERLLASVSRYLNERLVRLIRAESAARTGHSKEALESLEPPSASIQAALQAVREQCRDGTRLPDEIPRCYSDASLPVMEDDDQAASTELVLSPLLTRAFAYWTLSQTDAPEQRREDLERAFDNAALAVNLAPLRSGQRVLLAMIYRRLGLTKQADALTAKTAAKKSTGH